VALPDDWNSNAWKWKAALPGDGHSSPVVFRGGVYAASADEATGTRFLTCHDTTDGSLRWQREFAGPIDPHHAQNSSASGSVAASDHGVVWLWATKDNLRVEALSTAGEPLWHADLGPYACEHGFGASPAMWRDLVIVPIDHDGPSAIVALDAATGGERWRTPRETARTAYSTPLVIGTCGEGGGDNLLVAVRPPQGVPPAGGPPPVAEIAYTLDRSVAPYVPTPVAAGGRIYFRTTRQLFAP